MGPSWEGLEPPEVVCDAGPLIHLDEIDCLDLLDEPIDPSHPPGPPRGGCPSSRGVLKHRVGRLPSLCIGRTRAKVSRPPTAWNCRMEVEPKQGAPEWRCHLIHRGVATKNLPRADLKPLPGGAT
jgi:hypothetical protein